MFCLVFRRVLSIVLISRFLVLWCCSSLWFLVLPFWLRLNERVLFLILPFYFFCLFYISISLFLKFGENGLLLRRRAWSRCSFLWWLSESGKPQGIAPTTFWAILVCPYLATIPLPSSLFWMVCTFVWLISDIVILVDWGIRLF